LKENARGPTAIQESDFKQYHPTTILDKNGQYYYLFTNKTTELTALELKSSNILKILKKRQSWGKAFPKNGQYTINNGKLYTKFLWNPIKILSKNEIKYLNKTFYLK